MKIPITIKDDKIITSCKCDGTYGFAYELQRALKEIGCTNIQVETEEVTNPDPPWMCERFIVSGDVNNAVIEYINKHGGM